MPRGKYPTHHFASPALYLPPEQVYADFDAFTHEFFEDEPFHDQIDMFIPLPPMYYEGRFVKGIFCSQAVDYLIKLYPSLQQLLFLAVAYSMCGACPGPSRPMRISRCTTANTARIGSGGPNPTGARSASSLYKMPIGPTSTPWPRCR